MEHGYRSAAIRKRCTAEQTSHDLNHLQHHSQHKYPHGVNPHRAGIKIYLNYMHAFMRDPKVGRKNNE